MSPKCREQPRRLAGLCRSFHGTATGVPTCAHRSIFTAPQPVAHWQRRSGFAHGNIVATDPVQRQAKAPPCTVRRACRSVRSPAALLAIRSAAVASPPQNGNFVSLALHGPAARGRHGSMATGLSGVVAATNSLVGSSVETTLVSR